tara:strand:- start:402 stop:1280 length:879 start_codon:yes stop_codon:yes gene_type:complete
VIITGATSGIGLAAAEQLARCRASVVLVGRNSEKTQQVRNDLVARTGNSAISAVVADMSDFESVRHAAAAIRNSHDRLDVLIHNAGAIATQTTYAPNGSEVTVASQLIGPFLLTGLLLDLLARSESGRVITVSSGGMYTVPLSIDELREKRGINVPPSKASSGATQYSRVKRAQVTMNELWAERVPDHSVVFHAMHPGWVDTPGLQNSLPRFRQVMGPILRSPRQGADTLAWLAADDGVPLHSSGRFWHDRRPRTTHRLRRTRRSEPDNQRQQIWELCKELSAWDENIEPMT